MGVDPYKTWRRETYMDTRQSPLLESGSSHPPCQRVIWSDIYPHSVTDATCAGGEMGGVSAEWEYADYKYRPSSALPQ